MEEKYTRFFAVWLLLVSKLASCQQMHASLNNNWNIFDPGLKEQILSIARESLMDAFVKLGSNFDRKLEDLGIDLRHRVFELNEEIYNLKEDLIRQGFTLEKQPTNYIDTGQESRGLSSKFASLEKEIEKSNKESKRETRLLKNKLDIIENENRMLSSRLDATQKILMKMSPLSTIRTNNSDSFISVDILQKLDNLDNRLNDLNETVWDVSNTSVKMVEVIGTFQSEVSTLKQSMKTLNLSVNSSLESINRNTEGLAGLTKYIQLNVTKEINNNEQDFSKKLQNVMTDVAEVRNLSNLQSKSIHDLRTHDGQSEVQIRRLGQEGQEIRTKLIVLENDYNITMSDFENIKYKQKEISSEMVDYMLQISSLKDSWNATNGDLMNLESNVFGNLTDLRTQARSFCKRALNDLRSNVSEATEISNRIRTALRNLSSDHSVHSLKIQSLNHNVSRLQSDIELLKYEQNQTTSNISEITVHQRSTNASISLLDSTSVSMKESLNECMRKTDNFNSANNLKLKQLQQQFTVIQSNMSYFQTILDENELRNENVTFHIQRIQHDKSRMEKSVNDLMSNLSFVIGRGENMRNEMKNMTLEWSSFLKENTMEIKVIKQKMNSTAEDSKDLKILINANNASCETNIKDVKTSLKQFTVHLSSVDASITNLQQDMNSSKMIQERSKDEIYNITTSVQELQNQINNTGMTGKRQEELTSLFESITDHETRLTSISAEVTSNRANIASFQSNLNSAVEVNNAQNETLLRINNRLISLVPVRLVGGSSQNEGRVEVRYSGTWGTVCDDSWDNSDARVVCRMLGYTGYTAYGSAHFGQGSGTIWLDDVGCTGSENSIFSCRHSGMGTHNCGHGEDASVVCT